MPLIKWDPSLSVGVEEVDKQHQLLIQRINDLYKAMKAGREHSVLRKLINQLSTYAAMHFAKEEHYFDIFGYPEAQSHKNEHADFEQKVLQFEKDFNNGRQTLSDEIMTFLGNWLANHIKGSDKKYESFFKERGFE
jgi:hemerythrin-like metal-binding protein